jgi:hypothetical protein
MSRLLPWRNLGKNEARFSVLLTQPRLFCV